MTNAPRLDHPTFALVKGQFPNLRLRGTEFRGQPTLIVEPGDLHAVTAFLRDKCGYGFLADVVGIDYLGYPGEPIGRFAVAYVLRENEDGGEFIVKTHLDPSVTTEGAEDDPALVLDSVTDLWPGAEWMEREVFDMFGIRFANHPDLRRILTWEAFGAHPLRKDYPLRGLGERESYRIVDRTSS